MDEEGGDPYHPTVDICSHPGLHLVRSTWLVDNEREVFSIIV